MANAFKCDRCHKLNEGMCKSTIEYIPYASLNMHNGPTKGIDIKMELCEECSVLVFRCIVEVNPPKR